MRAFEYTSPTSTKQAVSLFAHDPCGLGGVDLGLGPGGLGEGSAGQA